MRAAAMSFTAIVAAVAPFNSVLAAPAPAKRANHDSAPRHARGLPKASPSTAFQVADWATLTGPSSKSASWVGLNVDVAADDVEEILVLGKRQRHGVQESVPDDSRIQFGPAIVTGTTNSDRPDFSSLKVTAAIPVGGIPGLNAVMNLSGGYDQVNASTTSTSVAATVGLRLKF